MYSLSEREKQLGLGEKGVTKYFSPNCDASDSDIVNKYLKAKNIEGQFGDLLQTRYLPGPTYICIFGILRKQH